MNFEKSNATPYAPQSFGSTKLALNALRLKIVTAVKSYRLGVLGGRKTALTISCQFFIALK
jgi:hypothetical protein